MRIFESRLFWPKYREQHRQIRYPDWKTSLGATVSFLHAIEGVVLPVLDLDPVF
jgi:hypothetical protein